MNKPLIIIQCPIATRSGYGERSRDIVRSLLKYKDKYEIGIVPTRWGNTPMNALDEERDAEIINLILTEPINRQPDVFIQITVPSEFIPFGKYNIGITAGIETTLAPSNWVEGCNKMDLVLTSSNFSKEVLEKTMYNRVNNHTQQVEGQLSVETQLDVLFEGIDETIYSNIYSKSPRIEQQFNDIDEKFCFLFVGHWLNGQLGEDRKNVGLLILNFLETFKDAKDAPALILKTSGGAFSKVDENEIVKKINAIKKTVEYKVTLPSIYLMYGDMTDSEMNDLYNHPKVRCHISLTKGEGFGRPLMEAAMSGKPIITTNWSGHLDFLKSEYNTLLNGTMTAIHPTSQNNMLLKEAQWFSVDVNAASAAMKDVVKNWNTYSIKAKKNIPHIKYNFSLAQMGERLEQIIDKNIVKEIPFKLPTLKRLDK